MYETNAKKRQNGERKTTLNMSQFPHLESRSLNHLFPGNLKTPNLSGHLSQSSTSCSFGTSTGIIKANLGVWVTNTASGECSAQCCVTAQKRNRNSFGGLCCVPQQWDTAPTYRERRFLGRNPSL